MALTKNQSNISQFLLSQSDFFRYFMLMFLPEKLKNSPENVQQLNSF